MNYCCAMRNCPGCVMRAQDLQRRSDELLRREARRVLLGNAWWPPTKQNAVVDEIIKEHP